MKGTRAARHRTDSDIVPPPAWQCGQAAHSRTQASWRAARRAGLDPEGRSGYTLQPAGSAARGRRRHSRNGDAGATDGARPARRPSRAGTVAIPTDDWASTFRILEAREDSGPSGSPQKGMITRSYRRVLRAGCVPTHTRNGQLARFRRRPTALVADGAPVSTGVTTDI